MNILVVSHEFPPIGGGGANACYFLTKGFAENGHDVTLVTANYRDMAGKEVQNGVTIFRVNAKRSHREHCSFTEMLDFLRRAWRKTKKLVQNQTFDICFVFFGIPSGPIGYLLKQRYRIPYVIRFGGGDVPGFQERFTVIYRLLGPAIKAIWNHADALVMNSAGLVRMAQRFYDRPEFTIITNGVDDRLFVPAEEKKSREAAFRLLFVSRLIKRKGLQNIIPQLSEINKTAEKPVHLTIVGDGPYRGELEQLVRACKADEYVSFEGQKNREELAGYYQDADLFVFPSEKEGMPNVILEAMACGLPIIMTPCEGSEELIDKNGYVCMPEQFGGHIAELMGNDELLRRMSENSRRLAEQKFSWKHTVDSYLSLFDDIIRK